MPRVEQFPVRVTRRRASSVVSTLVAGATLIALSPAGAATPVLSAGKVHGVVVLLGSGRKSLYLLSSERAGHLRCTAACLSIWPPVLVASAVRRVALGAGVHGTIGFVARTRSTKQVTFNSYPLYYYAGDSGPTGSAGEGVVADGGTWYLVRAGARTRATTPVTTWSSTTTTTARYGY